MKTLACKVFGKPAAVVGYCPGRKGKVMAVVICEGVLRAVRLRDIELLNLPENLQRPDADNVVPMTRANV